MVDTEPDLLFVQVLHEPVSVDYQWGDFIALVPQASAHQRRVPLPGSVVVQVLDSPAIGRDDGREPGGVIGDLAESGQLRGWHQRAALII